ncbi:MAG: AAA family ATPase [Verrucomicrobia bacterium]|nr:AAA family ATPase [Verrucomicrobiota bacterium]
MSTPIVKRVCTKTHKLSIERLKGIRSLEEVLLEDKPITGIFGPNGNGKSTILHALAAAYQAPSHAKGLHYQRFFPRLDQDIWNGTRFRSPTAARFPVAQLSPNTLNPTPKGQKQPAGAHWKPDDRSAR